MSLSMSDHQTHCPCPACNPAPADPMIAEPIPVAVAALALANEADALVDTMRDVVASAERLSSRIDTFAAAPDRLREAAQRFLAEWDTDWSRFDVLSECAEAMRAALTDRDGAPLPASTATLDQADRQLGGVR